MEYDPQQPFKGPLPPPRKHNTITNIIVVILSIILICALFFGLYMYSYTNIYHHTLTTPTGALNFTETTPGNYTGGLITLAVFGINLSDVTVKIIDHSMRGEYSLEGLFNHATLEADGGLRCTFEDTNGNHKLDIEDRFYLWNVDSGEILKLVYTKMGGVIAQYNFE